MTTNWLKNALCATPENVEDHFGIWFQEEGESPDQTALNVAVARDMCMDCPVRWHCLKAALETQTIHGFRGGLTEDEIRQVLSLDEFGKEVRRPEYPFCPYCRADTEHLVPTTIDLPNGGRWSVAKAVKCDQCTFEWKSRASHNSLLAYKREMVKRKEAEEREAAAVRGLKPPTPA